MSTWARAALDRSEKLITLCAPVDAEITSRAGSRPDRPDPRGPAHHRGARRTAAAALPDGDHGLAILVWANAVITATSRTTHEEIETTLARLAVITGVGAVRLRPGWKREGAGIEHLDLAVARHPDGLQGKCLALRRTADTLYVDGEIDMSNLGVFATALHALTDTPSPTVRIDLNAVMFLAAAGVRTLIRDTAPYRDRGADVEIHATPHITRILQLLDIHRLPQLHLSCRGVPANTR